MLQISQWQVIAPETSAATYLEAELGLMGGFADWRQLQEVSTDDELNSSKWIFTFPDSSGI